jgi:DNA gyrase inhibitor GyrI
MEEMQFVVPAEVAKEGAPTPSQDSVSLKRNPGGPYAVLRHRGWGRGEERREKLEQLRKEIEKRGLKGKGDPMFAGYDPPWTPGFLRRNEVLIPIE